MQSCIIIERYGTTRKNRSTPRLFSSSNETTITRADDMLCNASKSRWTIQRRIIILHSACFASLRASFSLPLFCQSLFVNFRPSSIEVLDLGWNAGLYCSVCPQWDKGIGVWSSCLKVYTMDSGILRSAKASRLTQCGARLWAVASMRSYVSARDLEIVPMSAVSFWVLSESRDFRDLQSRQLKRQSLMLLRATSTMILFDNPTWTRLNGLSYQRRGKMAIILRVSIRFNRGCIGHR
ncbi:hypothetical protein F5Y18DRAFT_169601 [Xylariaceae sp. FL1019]|nr:hypothetical protein F5Y18DRAFT_169601 [Xylariaceae sp. FL1019]